MHNILPQDISGETINSTFEKNLKNNVINKYNNVDNIHIILYLLSSNISKTRIVDKIVMAKHSLRTPYLKASLNTLDKIKTQKLISENKAKIQIKKFFL